MCLMVWRVSDCHTRCPSIKVLSEISLISSVCRGGWDESTDLIIKQLSLAIHSIDLFTCVLLSCNCNENDQNFRPFKGPAKEEDDDLHQDQELPRGQIEPKNEMLDDFVTSKIGKYGRKGP